MAKYISKYLILGGFSTFVCCMPHSCRHTGHLRLRHWHSSAQEHVACNICCCISTKAHKSPRPEDSQRSKEKKMAAKSLNERMPANDILS